MPDEKTEPLRLALPVVLHKGNGDVYRANVGDPILSVRPPNRHGEVVVELEVRVIRRLILPQSYVAPPKATL